MSWDLQMVWVAAGPCARDHSGHLITCRQAPARGPRAESANVEGRLPWDSLAEACRGLDMSVVDKVWNSRRCNVGLCRTHGQHSTMLPPRAMSKWQSYCWTLAPIPRRGCIV